MRTLPDISDQKTAIYNNEAIIGRSFPLYTYSHSGDRTISIQIHYINEQESDYDRALQELRWIQSAVYPRQGDGCPYKPPPVCQIKCGDLLASGNTPVCAVLQSYSVKFDPSVAWWEQNYCPYKFDVDTSWLTVYTSSALPFQDQIVQSGY